MKSMGQYRINPPADHTNDPISIIKHQTANLIDFLVSHAVAQTKENTVEAEEALRCFEHALTQYEQASMWATKALTKPLVSTELDKIPE
jgi:hypothetical protein